MSKKRTYIIILIILALTFLAGNFIYPKLLNLPYFSQKPFKLGLDLQGGTHLIYEADLSKIAEEDKAGAMEGLRDVIERRVNYFGVSEPVVQVQKQRLIVELAGIIDPAEAIKQIGQTPFLEFREQKENYQEIIENIQKKADAGESDFEDPFQSTILTGKYLKSAEIGFDQTTYQSEVLLEFDSEGAKIFEELTSKNIGKILAIYLDGIPISRPVVQDVISGGKAQITGKFTTEEATFLVRNLNAGALPVPIKLISQQSVGPTLGKDSLDKSLKAGFLGFMAILLFLIIFYRIPGFFASIALLVYIIFLLALFKVLSVTLTLAGIAGFVLSMGMAIDANILIFSRMREELRQGRSYLAAFEGGVKRAWPSIRDGNFTTILVGLILFAFGTSFVKGFAFTLVLGNLFGMFTAIVVTNNFLKPFLGDKSPKWMWLWR